MIKNIIKSMVKKLRYIMRERPLRFYEIDGFRLDMGKDHALSLIQKYHPMYDRINPHLARLAEAKGKIYTGGDVRWIIDIGANVGDTTAAMVRHTNANILCIEPTKYFYSLLQKNIASLGKKYENRVDIANCYIAFNDAERYTSDRRKGTAVKKKIDSTKISAEADTCTLIDVINSKQIPLECIDLIKIDTDGYDSECIMSLEGALSEASLCIYWENFINTKEHLDKYMEMIEYLKKMGYTLFFVFDNFGNYLCKGDAMTIKEINLYLFRMLQKKSARTFDYIDILACKKEDETLCQKIVKFYLNNSGENNF